MDRFNKCGAGGLPAADSSQRVARRRDTRRLPVRIFWEWIMIAGVLLGAGACTPPSPASGRGAEASSAYPIGQTSAPAPTARATLPPPLSPTATDRPAPSPTPTATRTRTPTPPACLAAGGRIERGQLYTDLSRYPWEFRVYVPPCYDQEPKRRYPVLTLIHGSTFNDDQWDRMGADEIADRLIASGELEPFLIFMPRDRIWVEPAGDPFGEALVSELLPWLESNYRTKPGRKYRAVGGLSRGASWAIHLGLSHWELFGSLGAHSLPVFWSDTGKVRGWLAAIPPADLPRIYLDIGENDYLIKSALWFENVLTEMDIPHEWYLYPGRHEEAYWAAHLEGYLRWYAREW